MDESGLQREPLEASLEGALVGPVVGVEALHVVLQRVHASEGLVTEVAAHLGPVGIVDLQVALESIGTIKDLAARRAGVAIRKPIPSDHASSVVGGAWSGGGGRGGGGEDPDVFPRPAHPIRGDGRCHAHLFTDADEHVLVGVVFVAAAATPLKGCCHAPKCRSRRLAARRFRLAAPIDL